MFTQRPIFIRIRRYGQRLTTHAPRGAWWLLMVPGLALIILALAIAIWPVLLAYMVAGALLLAGIALAAAGWRMRQAARRSRPQVRTTYVSDEGDGNGCVDI
ncbi:MAG: hypothetical protein IT330_02470 [Anaerolineae bacterium]|nr:hypothetical protein [Anaerolineae bacterium]